VTDNDEHGVALVIVMMTITLLTALGAALTLATVTETAIAANYREAAEVLYAAEGAVEFVMQELAGVADWRDVIAQPGRSAFVDRPAGGIRTVGAVTVDLTQATRDSEPSVLYAFGRFQDLVGSGTGRSLIYVAVWVADRSKVPVDDTSEPEALSVLGQAYGLRGSRQAVEAIVTKADSSAVRVLSWREWR
jgi:type IV pilus assembly PilX-like protein